MPEVVKIKKRYVFFSCIGLVVCLAAVAIFTLNFVANRKYYISGRIASVSVTSSLDGVGGSKRDPLQTSDRDELTVLLKCIKKVKINNQHRIKDIETAPISYNITFIFKSGQSKTYEYKVYPATECNNPFADFYEFFP